MVSDWARADRWLALTVNCEGRVVLEHTRHEAWIAQGNCESTHEFPAGTYWCKYTKGHPETGNKESHCGQLFGTGAGKAEYWATKWIWEPPDDMLTPSDPVNGICRARVESPQYDCMCEAPEGHTGPHFAVTRGGNVVQWREAT